MNIVSETLGSFLYLYSMLLIVRILLTWFQGMDWANQIAGFLSPITDPYLNIFRSFIPPIGGLDLSPILAIFCIQIISGLF